MNPDPGTCPPRKPGAPGTSANSAAPTQGSPGACRPIRRTSATLGRVILGLPAYAACTPAGIMRLLAEYAVPLDGAYGVVIGRSPILGRPMASMLINAHADVPHCRCQPAAMCCCKYSVIRHTDLEHINPDICQAINILGPDCLLLIQV